VPWGAWVLLLGVLLTAGHASFLGQVLAATGQYSLAVYLNDSFYLCPRELPSSISFKPLCPKKARCVRCKNMGPGV
jgi:hypothetical protein